MQLLADESCHFGFVRALRAAWHDVLAVAELTPGAPDPAVMELARQHGRVLLTEDRDFGALVFAYAQETAGVIYLRYPDPGRASATETLMAFVSERPRDLRGTFAVVQPGRIRISPAPSA